MRPDERDPGALWDIVHYGKLALSLAEGKSSAELTADSAFALAIERLLEIIGEAANNVSEIFKSQHPEIPWRSIRGQRNVIVHMYSKIDYAEIWKTVSIDLPAMIGIIEPLIPEPPSGST